MKENTWRLKTQYNCGILIIEKDTSPVLERIASIKEWINKELEKAAQETAEQIAKQDAARRKRLLKKAGDERKLLEELRKKYPD